MNKEEIEKRGKELQEVLDSIRTCEEIIVFNQIKMRDLQERYSEIMAERFGHPTPRWMEEF